MNPHTARSSTGGGGGGGGSRRLYHYTCTCHGLLGVSETGLLLPHYQPMLTTTLTWLTTLAQAHPLDLGMTNQTIACDRSAVRLTVAPTGTRDAWGAIGLQQWRSWAAAHRVPTILCEIIEGGTYPHPWLVATVPLTVTETFIASRGFHAVGPTLPPDLDPHRDRRGRIPPARTPAAPTPTRRAAPPAAAAAPDQRPAGARVAHLGA